MIFDQLPTDRHAICVGLDPHAALLAEDTAHAAERFCLRLIESIGSEADAYKPNSAFFERYGAAGWAAMQRLTAAAKRHAPVILDAKRGDIGSTAEAYADAAVRLGADAITVSPYVGPEAIEPFAEKLGVFVLGSTTNPRAEWLQGVGIPSVSDRVLSAYAEDPRVGFVVGAVDPEVLAAARRLAPDSWFLSPGIGAQGGDASSAVAAGSRADGAGVLISASRSIATVADPLKEV